MPILAVNKKAKFDYELLESYQAGLVLTGWETKTAKLGQVSLKSTFVTVKGVNTKHPEFYLTNAIFTPYKCSRREDCLPDRSRKLLLTKKEIERLVGKLSEKGLTLVPNKLYTINGFIKLEFSLARGKKKYDKRADIKKRDIDRQLKQNFRVK